MKKLLIIPFLFVSHLASPQSYTLSFEGVSTSRRVVVCFTEKHVKINDASYAISKYEQDRSIDGWVTHQYWTDEGIQFTLVYSETGQNKHRFGYRLRNQPSVWFMEKK